MAGRLQRRLLASWPVLLMVSASFALVLPALFIGRDAFSGDGHVHILWQEHFAEAVWQGTLYPRWLPEMNDGFGSPAFFFYPPLLQWFGAIFQPMLPSASDAATRLTLAIWILSMIGGTGCLLWLRALGVSRCATWFGALTFLLMPYRCFVDVYQRGAVAEMAGLCVMPWLLYFASRLYAGRPGSWGGYGVATAALLLSNLPGAEIGLLCATAYSLTLAGTSKWRFLFGVATATIVGILIAAINLTTVIGYFRFLTFTADLWSPRNQPVSWLLFSKTPWVDPSVHMMTLGLTAFALVAGGVLTALALPDRPSILRRTALFLAAAIVIVALMNTAIARPIWALDTPLRRIQFPFRLLAIHVVALSGLAALALDRLGTATFSRAKMTAMMLWIGLPGLLVGDAAFLAFQTLHHARTGIQDAEAGPGSNIDAKEYVLGDLALLRRGFGTGIAHVVSGSARVRLVSRESRHLTVAVRADTASKLALRSFAFSGWDCRVDHGDWQAAATIPYPFNLPVCTVPPGLHLLEIRMPVRPIETTGRALSLIGILLSGAELLIGLARPGRRIAAPAESAPPRV